MFLYYLDTYQSAPTIQLESINNPKQLNKIPAQPTRLGITLPKQKKSTSGFTICKEMKQMAKTTMEWSNPLKK